MTDKSVLDFLILKYEYFYDDKLNIFWLLTKQDIWGFHLGNTDQHFVTFYWWKKNKSINWENNLQDSFDIHGTQRMNPSDLSPVLQFMWKALQN